MRILLAVVLVGCLASGGCFWVVAAAGAGAAAVGRETLDVAVTYKGNVNAVENAVKNAVKDLGAVISETVTESQQGKRTFRGKTFDGEALTIDVEPTTPNSTMVEVRVGRMGSVPRAEEVHAAIQKYAKVNK